MLRGKTSKLFFLILLGALAAVFWYFKSFRGTNESTPSPAVIAPGAGPVIAPPTTPPPGTGEAPAATPATHRFTVEGDEFKLFPATITVQRGSLVELTFKNIGRIPHNYIVDELGVATKTIDGGKTDVVTFAAPDTPGTITYVSYCSVPGHREAGMAGTIEIK